MKKLVLLMLSLIFMPASLAFGANIVYPKTSNPTITAPTTFFIGNESPNKKLYINGEQVKIHKSGGFLHPVDLNIGENVFTISNNKSTLTYKITRPEPKNHNTKFSPITYKSPVIYITNADLSPLRATPYSSGTNRLQSLQKDIPLKIVGEYADFYKVQLARDDYAWIGKSRVKKAPLQYLQPAKLLAKTFEETSTEYIYTYKLDRKVPFTFNPITIYETNKTLDFFNEKIKNYNLILYYVKDFPENKFDIDIDVNTKPFGYSIAYSDNNELIIKIKKASQIDKNQPLKGLKIMLDAGHGGYETGTVGCLGDKEKDINFAMALKLKEKLQKAGAIVIMTRVNDSALGLTERVLSAQKNNVDIFLSIHNNALPDSAARSERIGASTYYYNLHSHELAEKIQERLVNELKMNDDKVRRESFAVIRNTQTVAVLIEVGYLIKPEDNIKLIDSKFQHKAAQAILHGLENYLNEL